MNIIVNGRFLSRRVTGVERYVREMLYCMGERLPIIQAKKWTRLTSSPIWEQFYLPTEVRSDEILWSPANTGPIFIKNQILTLHDISPLEHPEWFSSSFTLWYRLIIPQLVKIVRHIIVPSVYVRSKIIKRFSLPNSKVSCIPGGVDLCKFHPEANRIRNLPANYILFVGSVQPRKNLHRLLEAWKQITPNHPALFLLIAGGTNNNFRTPTFDGRLERVHFLGYAPDEDLPGLYAGASLFVLPSLEEGFGLPILEAMACGTPVIASRAGALPEVLGDAGVLFDPKQPSSLAETLKICLREQNLRQSMVEKGLARAESFTWEKTVEQFWKVVESCQ
jgi:glycosyltransferase involved in cell wall biosynthesis